MCCLAGFFCSLRDLGRRCSQPAGQPHVPRYPGALGTYSTVFPQSTQVYGKRSCLALALPFPSAPPRQCLLACLPACFLKVRGLTLKSAQSVQLPRAVRCHAMSDALANHNAHAGIILTQQNIPPTGTHSARTRQHPPALTTTNNRIVCAVSALPWAGTLPVFAFKRFGPVPS